MDPKLFIIAIVVLGIFDKCQGFNQEWKLSLKIMCIDQENDI